ncbi:hypothetical protein G6F43_003254 [Rhizopus delemar]|nr:hypothetical protein G6F43_003254 [Rhizopus delemar]
MSNIFNQFKNNGDVYIIINAKRERSQSPALSNSSNSSVEVKRSKKINYFLGGGKKEWKPKEELLVKGINVTKAFKRFRQQSIGEVDRNNDINCLRILYFDKDTCNALKSLVRGLKPKLERAPTKAVVYCKNEADVGVVFGH